MENASKALLIAGAVLLVIAIIAIAIGIVNKTRGVMGTAEGQIDSMTIQIHNKQFEPFNKSVLTGIEAQELVFTVLSNNDKTKNEMYKITLELNTFKNGNPYNDIYIHSSENYNNNEYDSWQDGQVQINLEVNSSSITYANIYNCEITYDSNGIIKKFILSGDINR